MAVAVPILALLLALAVSEWFFHIRYKNIPTERLRQDIKGRDATIGMLNYRLDRLNSERVPLRSKCWCKHDAVAHDDNGCRVEYPFRWACACQISRDEVYYTPEPMRKMLPIGES